jgi:hypothetical protein
LATTISNPPNHGHDLDLHGPLPSSLLVVVTNDPFGCDPFGRGCDLDCHLPSFISWL